MMASDEAARVQKVYASSTDQVLLALLCAVREHVADPVAEEELAQVFADFQGATGTILYGSVGAPDDRRALTSDLGADLQSLTDRGLIYRTPNPHAGITLLGIPAANSLVLPSPFEQLVQIARKRLAPR